MVLASSGSEASPPTGPATPEARWTAYLHAAARGDQSALASLYDETSSLVHGIVQRILMNPADAEEVTLDVYTQIWRSAADYSPQRGSPAAWILMLARSRALDRLRTRQRRTGPETPIDPALPLASSSAHPEELALLGQQRRQMRLALAELAVEQRQAIELAYFGGLSHSELAEKLGQPLGTVKTRIRLGMTRLRQLLTPGKEVR